MSAKPLLTMLFLLTLGAGVPLGCGGDEEEGGGGKKGKKKGAAGGVKAKQTDDDGSSVHDYETITVGPEEDVVHLGEAPVISDPGSVLEGTCATYIACACAIEEQQKAENPDQSTLGQCERVKAVFADAPERDGECAERLAVELAAAGIDQADCE